MCFASGSNGRDGVPFSRGETVTKHERATSLVVDALDALTRGHDRFHGAADDPTDAHYSARQFLRASTCLALASHLLTALHDLTPDRELLDRLQSTASDLRTHVPPPSHGERRGA